MITEQSPNSKQEGVASLTYLFFTFLKVGMVSFGGNMALVAVIKNIMVDRDKRLKNETILDAVGIASLLPGPMAVNVVAYIGYDLRKRMGAVVSMTGVILPACTAMLMLSWAYFKFGYHQQFKEVMYYVTGAVSAIIASTGFQLFAKSLTDNKAKIIICILSVAGIILTNSFLLTMAFITAGGMLGVWLNIDGKKNLAESNSTPAQKPVFGLSKSSLAALTGLGSMMLLFISNAQQYTHNIIVKMILVFGGISLTLFGGGYVMIPIMQNLFVTEMHWLTNQEFLDAIAFSQSTPGPILVSATFIGYKLSGVIGAVLATIAIFAPSAILMILVSRLYGGLKHHVLTKKILAGVKAVVIGLIIGAAVKIAQQVTWGVPLAAITVISFIASFRYKVSPVYIILSSALAGYVTWYFSK
ncbi:chromate efflux transporter [Agriterribacter sp.]|uniref:chromate efflux transporter n=1 Tax=Agriterribacter sp. TaxID=2821509 RepID=UPI002B8F5EBE|nr:chromate efflux transporter [Agriterribacter sp.]HTN05478.1 chromate efflux transporter [Agriterribacter sp.]